MTSKNLMDMKIGHGVFQYDRLLENSDGNVIVGDVMFGHNGPRLDTFEIPNGYMRVLDLFSYSPIVYRRKHYETIFLEKQKTEKEMQEAIDSDAISQQQEGDVIKLGLFPQNKDLIPEPIEWKVIKRNNDILTLITKKAIIKMNYHNSLEEVYWEESTLRQWLNGPFYEFSFLEEEKNGSVLWQFIISRVY